MNDTVAGEIWFNNGTVLFLTSSIRYTMKIQNNDVACLQNIVSK